MTWIPPDLSGRTYAVTGGNAGIGRHVAGQLKGAGAEVVILARDPRQATVRLDLADLESVEEGPRDCPNWTGWTA